MLRNDLIVIDGEEFVLPADLPLRDRWACMRHHHSAYEHGPLDAVADSLKPGWHSYAVYTYTPLCGHIR